MPAISRVALLAVGAVLLLANPAQARQTGLLDGRLASPLATDSFGDTLLPGGGVDDGGMHCFSPPLEWFFAWLAGGIGGYGVGAIVAVILGASSSSGVGYAIYTFALLVLRPLGDAFMINLTTQLFDHLKSNFLITFAADALAGLLMFAITGWDPENGIGALLVAPVFGVLAANYGPPGSGNGLITQGPQGRAARPIAVVVNDRSARTPTATVLAMAF